MRISEIKEYDKKRCKIIAEEGEKSFLLYKGELRRLGLSEGDVLTEEGYEQILREILIPRAKKRVLYYLKTGDKSKAEVQRKLKENGYPKEAVSEALRFLESHRFVDDKRYAEHYVYAKKGSHSKREMAAKLYQKGISRADADAELRSVTAEDENEACLKALRKYSAGSKRLLTETELAELTEYAEREEAAAIREEQFSRKRKAYAYLQRKGYGYDAIEYAFNHL